MATIVNLAEIAQSSDSYVDYEEEDEDKLSGSIGIKHKGRKQAMCLLSLDIKDLLETDFSCQKT